MAMTDPSFVAHLKEVLPVDVRIDWRYPTKSEDPVDIEIERVDGCTLLVWYLVQSGAARMLLDLYTFDEVRPDHVLEFIKIFVVDGFCLDVERVWLARCCTLTFDIGGTIYSVSRKARNPAAWENRHLANL